MSIRADTACCQDVAIGEQHALEVVVGSSEVGGGVPQLCCGTIDVSAGQGSSIWALTSNRQDNADACRRSCGSYTLVIMQHQPEHGKCREPGNPQQLSTMLR